MTTYASLCLGLFPGAADCTDAFAWALEQLPDGSILQLEPGEYHFSAASAGCGDYSLSNSDILELRRLSVLLRGRHDVMVDGCGARLVFHGQTMPFTLDGCNGVTLKNFTIDWDIPLTAEGVVEASCDNWVDISIDPKLYPFHLEEDTLVFDGGDWHEPVWQWGNTEFDTRTGQVAAGRGDTWPKTTQQLLENGQVRFSGGFAGHRPQPGNVVVLRHGRREHAGIFVHNSENVCLENITMHANGGLGILAQFSRDLTFRRIRMEPNRAAGRMFAGGHDDGIHLSADSGLITVEECSFMGLMDDPLNLHGIAARLERVENSRTVIGRFVHPQSNGFDLWALPGHAIAVLDGQDMHSLGTVRARAFTLLDRELFRLELEEELPAEAKAGASLENMSRTAALVCRRNRFGACRARGVLCCTPRPVRIEDNVFESAGAAILIPGDACTWYESGRCRDVTIRGNYFAPCCLRSEYLSGDAVISIHPELPAPRADRPCHTNITVEDNTFHTADGRVLYALCTSGLRFCGNRILRSYALPAQGENNPLVTTQHCTGVAVSRNVLVGDVVGGDLFKKEYPDETD